MPAYDIQPARTKADRKAFLAVPRRVLADDANYVPPLAMEEIKKLKPGKHPFYGHGEAAFWIARDVNGEAVGRISAQVNSLHQKTHDKDEGHFGALIAIDDAGLYGALLAKAEAWLSERGVAAAIGPANLSVNEEFGLLIDGFDRPPMMLMGHDPAWSGAHIETAGYEKAKDLIAYAYDPTGGPPARLKAFAAKFDAIPGARIRTFDKRRFSSDLEAVLAVFNDAWADNWGAIPMTRQEIDGMAHAFKQLADYGLIFIVEIEGEAVGMAVSLPNINEALAGLDGARSPLALAKFLWRLKVRGPSTARVLLMGVIKRVQADLALGPLVGMALVNALVEAHRAKGYQMLELSWILEDNTPMRRLAEVGGATPYKTYRVFRKALR